TPQPRNHKRHPREERAATQDLLGHRHDGEATLRLLCPHAQDRRLPRRWIRGHHPPRRRARLPRQPESANRARRTASRLLPTMHRRATQG
ncbi:hypothetical protein LTR53_020515, partial [Teratosphaeriaceae sp. CCFEE 6253]